MLYSYIYISWSGSVSNSIYLSPFANEHTACILYTRRTTQIQYARQCFHSTFYEYILNVQQCAVVLVRLLRVYCCLYAFTVHV